MPPMLGSYAEWQFARAATPRSVLDELVRRAAGADVEKIDRIVEGYSNEIYRVRCADGQGVVVRILRFDDDVTSAASAGEAWAIEQARAAGVPVPEILLLDTVHVDGSEYPVMVQRTVPGRPLGELVDRLSERQRHDVLVELGGLIARLNGVLVNDGRDWPTKMAADLAHLQAERHQLFAGGISAPEFDRISDLLQDYIRDFRCDQGVLCHGDLSVKHIFVTGDSSNDAAVYVSGIIDFGDWLPGPRVHDLAVLRVRSPRVDLPPLLTGYGTARCETFRRQLDLHTLIIALGSLAFGVTEGDRTCIEDSGELIRGLLGDLDVPN